ncbi:MAG: VCBS repeat-containing protein [Acidobacteriaceae bacterium]|nr:VCBS repeat-containing protein [Acidobacteriaceae bacterium]
MFNLSAAVTVAIINENYQVPYHYHVQNLTHEAGAQLDFYFNGPNDSSPDLTHGVMSDFNADGYDDLALSYGDGSIQIATASNVNYDPGCFCDPLVFGPAVKLDVLSDMAAGDFNGDGQREIAGLSILSNGGLKLVIYTVDPSSLGITLATSLTLNTASAGAPINVVSMARGRFNTTTHDQLAVVFATNSGSSIAEVIDFAPNALNPVEGPQLTASTVSIPDGYLQVQTGQFNFSGNSLTRLCFIRQALPTGAGFLKSFQLTLRVSRSPSTEGPRTTSTHVPPGYRWATSIISSRIQTMPIRLNTIPIPRLRSCTALRTQAKPC